MTVSFSKTKQCPAILINKTHVKTADDFDIELIGDCDKILREVSKRLGWAIEEEKTEKEASSDGSKKQEREKTEANDDDDAVISNGHVHYFGKEAYEAASCIHEDDEEDEDEEEEEAEVGEGEGDRKEEGRQGERATRSVSKAALDEANDEDEYEDAYEEVVE